MGSLFQPIARATAQMDDRAFVTVLLQSLALSALCFALILAGAVWSVQAMLSLHGWLAWLAGLFGGVAAALLAFFLFLPVAAVIGTLFLETIAGAVERRWYPDLPPAIGASILAQTWDGVAVGLKILGLSLIALILALLLPGIGLILAWAINAYAIGRGLFVAVAMRRMPRAEAEAVYRENRPQVLAQGSVLAVASFVPVLNLLIAVLGTAAMVHVLDSAMTRPRAPR